MAVFRISKRAAADLTVIYAEGITRFGALQASEYRERLEGTFATLTTSPRIGREYVGTPEPVRVHFHQSHVITYKVVDTDIIIVRVLPARADWREHL
ncbi:MAG: type II toxin-antitoxin system RelE/ParE family toxin [Hyphomicrobium sp.]|jgi:toxin ParE1/3/4|uniref:type II toxin-antitoxin system RelE/ParE family toxin n=1 Tax=Hyphomicrobium sp. TaxID=82 RepID=UPI00344DF895|nr:type II toxin-antitoxin system RelE/ParE family toxin [Hyphomicrobium sp.]